MQAFLAWHMDIRGHAIIWNFLRMHSLEDLFLPVWVFSCRDSCSEWSRAKGFISVWSDNGSASVGSCSSVSDSFWCFLSPSPLASNPAGGKTTAEVTKEAFVLSKQKRQLFHAQKETQGCMEGRREQVRGRWKAWEDREIDQGIDRTIWNDYSRVSSSEVSGWRGSCESKN